MLRITECNGPYLKHPTAVVTNDCQFCWKLLLLVLLLEKPGNFSWSESGQRVHIVALSATSIGMCAGAGCDQVEFQVCESRKNYTKNAINVKVVSCVAPPVGKEYGYVAAAKDRRGLIEMVDHERVASFQLK